MCDDARRKSSMTHTFLVSGVLRLIRPWDLPTADLPRGLCGESLLLLLALRACRPQLSDDGTLAPSSGESSQYICGVEHTTTHSPLSLQ